MAGVADAEQAALNAQGALVRSQGTFADNEELA